MGLKRSQHAISGNLASPLAFGIGFANSASKSMMLRGIMRTTANGMKARVSVPVRSTTSLELYVEDLKLKIARRSRVR